MMKKGNLNETQMVMQLFLKYRYCLNQYNEKKRKLYEIQMVVF